MKNHIEPGTIIVTDGWPGCTFIDREDSVWKYEINNHGHGDFWVGVHSTLNIEHTWSHLKNEITNIHNIFPKEDYIYYIREAEFRLNICKKSDE